MRQRTVVVGGGLAGLLAARRRQRAGDQVLVLEQEAAVGGAIAADQVAGLELNIGAEAYSTASGAVDALLEELGLGGQIVSPRQELGSRVVSDAGVHRAPGASLLGIPGRPLAADVRAVLGTAGSLRASLERFLPARYGNRPGATVEELVRKRLGRRVADRLVAPIVGGVHSADPDVLEFATASPQLAAALDRGGSLIRAVRRIRGRSTASAGTRVHAVAPTMAALPKTLASGILEDGGILRTGVRVTRIEPGVIQPGETEQNAVEPDSPEQDYPEQHSPEQDAVWPDSPELDAVGEGAREEPARRWSVVTSRGERLGADHLVLACPPDVAGELLADAAPTISAAIPSAPSARVRLVALVLDAPALDGFPSGTGALVAPGTAGITAKALTHATAKWEHVQRLAREALATAGSPHVVRLSYGRPGEALPAPEGIVDLALADASAILGVPLRAEQLIESRVIDWDRAMRQARPGHRAALETLTGLLAAEPALELVGSWRAGTGIDAIVRADDAAADTTTQTTQKTQTPQKTQNSLMEGHHR
ncbi:MAG TPA: FAD-dependent oxidoreductase [Candidatus Brachybacterium merdavium]|uniref:FAD-dependent oxidoreductase n=1 Tax=Candidatus Brachybacterium merdavium TaxID=2838513 RepID=A0A9D2LB61_9MICO|nr:FAD-dependent oxidoreductase [Candidatus Brachybacterium merdavium]